MAVIAVIAVMVSLQCFPNAFLMALITVINAVNQCSYYLEFITVINAVKCLECFPNYLE
jgi:hypothetical protein